MVGEGTEGCAACACGVGCRDVTIVSEGVSADKAFEVIKAKKEDNVVVCNGGGDFVSAPLCIRPVAAPVTASTSSKRRPPARLLACAQLGIVTRDYFKDSRNYPAPGTPSLDGQGRLRCGEHGLHATLSRVSACCTAGHQGPGPTTTTIMLRCLCAHV